MDMGTGKSRVAIELVYFRQSKIDRVIWFCPVSLKTTVYQEIVKHTDSVPYVFNDKTNENSVPLGRMFYIVGIESISSSARIVFTANRLITKDTFVICDESSYIKTHNAIRTRRITAMADRCRYRLLLTGTPMTQGVVDLYAQMSFLSPKILGYTSFYSFAANHLEYSDKYPGMVIRSHNTAYLAAKLAPYIYQVTKDECLDLPDKIYDARYFSMTREQYTEYELTKAEILIDSDMDSYAIFKLFTKLQQISSGFLNTPKGIKRLPCKRLDILREIIQNIPGGEKVIIWCKYIESLRQIKDAFGDDCSVYYGGLSTQERDRELEQFRESRRFLCATMQTGGHGLTLTESAYAIFYENSFKYSDRIQAEDRIHRIGQTRKPTYISIYCDNGIERRIEKAIEEKESVINAFRREVEKKKKIEKDEL